MSFDIHALQSELLLFFVSWGSSLVALQAIWLAFFWTACVRRLWTIGVPAATLSSIVLLFFGFVVIDSQNPMDALGGSTCAAPIASV